MSFRAYISPPQRGQFTSVASSTSSAQFLTESQDRNGFSVYNDSTSDLYLLLAPGDASSSNYTITIEPSGYFEAPYAYFGEVNGVWASVNGSAKVTEYI